MPSCRPPAWSTITWSPASATRIAADYSASPASRSNDDTKIVRCLDPGLAAHAVGTAARSARSLAARYRDIRYRPWAGSRRALERTDQRRTYLFSRAAHAAGGGGAAPADAARRFEISARSIAA